MSAPVAITREAEVTTPFTSNDAEYMVQLARMRYETAKAGQVAAELLARSTSRLRAIASQAPIPDTSFLVSACLRPSYLGLESPEVKVVEPEVWYPHIVAVSITGIELQGFMTMPEKVVSDAGEEVIYCSLTRTRNTHLNVYSDGWMRDDSDPSVAPVYWECNEHNWQQFTPYEDIGLIFVLRKAGEGGNVWAIEAEYEPAAESDSTPAV